MKSFNVPAFPVNTTNVANEGACYASDGMSLRDYFAAKALAAMISQEGKDHNNRGKAAVPKLAKFAYEYADAMLAQRAPL